MIMSNYTRAGCGVTVDELLVVSGESAVGGETGATKTNIYLYRTGDHADKGRVSKTRERIVGAICRATSGFGMEDLESQSEDILAKCPALAGAVHRIYDRTCYSTGVYESGRCEDPHTSGFQKGHFNEHPGDSYHGPFRNNPN